MGTEEQLLRIPAQHCDRHKTKQACVNSMDPYCGWNEHKERCMPPPNNDPLSSVWHQDATQCPILTHPGNLQYIISRLSSIIDYIFLTCMVHEYGSIHFKRLFPVILVISR